MGLATPLTTALSVTRPESYRPDIVMPPFTYRAFGLAIESDAPVPGLFPSPVESADVQIHMGERPDDAGVPATPLQVVWRSEANEDDPADAVTLYGTSDGRYMHLAYADGVRFRLARDGREIWASWPESSSAAHAGTYLLGPVLGFVLRLRGITCLHASVVVVGGRAVALVGPAGMGKSTTAAAFALRGGRVIADDIAVLIPDGPEWMVHPTIPGLRLWDDSVEMLLGNREALPLLAQGWEKRHLDLQSSTAGFWPDAPVPLGAVYILADADPAQHAACRLHGRDALMALVSNTYANVLLDAGMREAEFVALSALARSVPVWRVPAPTGAQALADLCARMAAAEPATDFRPGAA